jgi:Raf kinase inhibitor-like YbhB/YbcL family protein
MPHQVIMPPPKPMPLGLKIFIGLFVVILLLWTIAWRARLFDGRYHAPLPATISLASASFPSNGDMPVSCTCSGAERMPELHWANLPSGTRSLALIVTDYDVPLPFLRFYALRHMVAYNISTTLPSLPEGINTQQLNEKGVAVAQNSLGEARYIGPCPPAGRHGYTFRLYALDMPKLTLEADAGKKELANAMKGHILSYGELVGYYAK